MRHLGAEVEGRRGEVVLEGVERRRGHRRSSGSELLLLQSPLRLLLLPNLLHQVPLGLVGHVQQGLDVLLSGVLILK